MKSKSPSVSKQPASEKHPRQLSSKVHKWRRGAFWVLLAVLGFLLNDGYTAAKDWVTDKPDYLKNLSEQQSKEFAALKDSLGQISSSIKSADLEAFRQVKSVVSSIEKTNAGLIQQLTLAKQENETLRKITSQKAGVSGGYDIILAEDSGLRIDSATVLGLTRVETNTVLINLTSADADNTRSAWLAVGESMNFQNAQGESCKVSLLSFNNSSAGAASFALNCAQALAVAQEASADTGA